MNEAVLIARARALKSDLEATLLELKEFGYSIRIVQNQTDRTKMFITYTKEKYI